MVVTGGIGTLWLDSSAVYLRSWSTARCYARQCRTSRIHWPGRRPATPVRGPGPRPPAGRLRVVAEPEALVELADGRPGVVRELAGRGLDHDPSAEEVQDLWPGGWYTHRLP